MTERIIVPFEGEDSGVDDLSWGQAEIWRAMQRQRSWIPLVTATPLAAGTTPADVAAELRFRMSRYPSMRTRLQFAADGTPRQALAASGQTALEIVDCGGEDPAAAAAAVGDRHMAAPLDVTTDWPLRMTAIRHRGSLTHVVTATCHLALDAFGAQAMLDDLATLDRRTGEAAEAPAALSPLRQAEWQRGAAGQRVSGAAMRHWESLLRTVPAQRFPAPADPRRPRYWEARFGSRALYLAARAIAARTGSGTSPVLLAAFAVGLARASASNPVLARVVVNNRFRPGLAGSVSQVAQTGLCVMDVADAAFDEAVTRAWRMSLTAYRHAYYDPAQLDRLVARLSSERGCDLDIDCFYNDRRVREPREPDGGVPAPADVLAALPETALRWQPPTGRPCEKFFLHVNDVPGTVDMVATADTAHVPPDAIETCLRAMEEIVVAAALDPAVRTSDPATCGER